MDKQAYVYIMTNARHTVLYVGVTSNLPQRAGQHKAGTGSVFTSKYKAHKLVFAEAFHNMLDAIRAEKQLKAGSRSRKEQLIREANPEWKDLSEEGPW